MHFLYAHSQAAMAQRLQAMHLQSAQLQHTLLQDLEVMRQKSTDAALANKL